MHWMFLANGSRFHYSFILIHFQEGVLGFLCEERRSKQSAATHWGPRSPKRTKAFLMDLVCISQGLLSALYKGRPAALCSFLCKQRFQDAGFNICITTKRMQSRGEKICCNRSIWRWSAWKILTSWWLGTKIMFSSLKKIEFWDWDR